MLFGILTLLTALAIAGVAAWFSIIGLMSIFSAAAMPIAIMAGTLEVGKLLTASWLYRYWNETSLLLKTYLSTAVVVLMLITSMGIFGYLSKAHLDQASESGNAFAIVERLEGQVAREENKISILEERIATLQSGSGVDNSQSISQQETIRDGAWERVKGDIDFANEQIQRLRDQLTVLDSAVNNLRAKGVEVITTDEGGAFRRAETETIDYVHQADALFEQQKEQRDQIRADIKSQQDNIDRYRAQAQKTIDDANSEINRLRDSSTETQDEALDKIDGYNEEIDTIYDGIVIIKDEMFQAESVVRELEKEVGPIKYVAQLVYGQDSEDYLDAAVRLFILLLVFVFDPLAVVLVIAANQTLLRYGINLEKSPPIKPKDPNELKQTWSNTDLGNIQDKDDFERQSREIYGDNMPNVPEIVEKIVEREVVVEKEVPVEVIKEVERVVEKEVELEVDMSTPPAIKELEKRLEKKLKKNDKKNNG